MTDWLLQRGCGRFAFRLGVWEESLLSQTRRYLYLSWKTDYDSPVADKGLIFYRNGGATLLRSIPRTTTSECFGREKGVGHRSI